MPNKLRKLMIDRVDLVPKGSNPESHVMLYKRELEKAQTTQEVLDREAELREAQNDKWRIFDAFIASLQSIMEVDSQEEQEALLIQSAREYLTLIEPIQEVLEPQEEDVVMAEKTPEVETPDLQDELDKAVERAEKAEAALAKSAEEEEDIWKGVAPEIKFRFDEMQASIEKAELQASAERDARVQQECIAKASGYTYMPINPDDDWAMFKAIDEMAEAPRARIYELLKAGEAAFKSAGLTSEKGSLSKEVGSMSAYDELTSVAKQLVEDGVATAANSIAKAAAANPDIYKRYQAELGGN